MFTGIKAILLKEFIHMIRDRATFGIMIGMPIIQLLLFGFSINNDPHHLPLGIVIQDEGPLTRSVLLALEHSDYFKAVERLHSPQDVDTALNEGKLSFVLTIPAHFEKQFLKNEQPQLLFEVDATDPGAIGGAVGTINTIISTTLQNETHKDLSSNTSVDIVIQKRYNPEGIMAKNIIPGLIGVILSMTMIMVTAIALTREREHGTMENLLVMPLSPFEIMVGKIIPYILVGLIQFSVVSFAGVFIFHVPFLGSLALATSMVLLFIIANLLVGYLFSTVAKTQMQANQLTFFFFLPSMLLSGFMFPFLGMPQWAQVLGEVFPLTHFLRIIRGIMLKGNDFMDISQEILSISIFIVTISFLAILRFRRTLE